MNLQILKSYSQNGLYRAVDIFKYPDEFPSLTRILGFRFLLQHNHIMHDYKPVPTKAQLRIQIKEMVQEYSMKHTKEGQQILMELVDVLIDYFPADGKELLAQLRECGGTANDNGPTINGPECTVYADSQSVHNKSISDTVRKAAKYLGDNYYKIYLLRFADKTKKCICNKSHPVYNYKTEHIPKYCFDCKDDSMIHIINKEFLAYPNIIKGRFIKNYPIHENILEPVFERLYIDNATFDINYSVDQIFFSILEWSEKELERTTEEYKNGKIEKEDIFNIKTCENRLCEELIEMQGYCSSAMLSHIINSIQGLSIDKNIQITISGREQVKSVMYTHLNKAVQSCGDDEIIEGITEGGDKFLNFIKKEIADNIDRWYDEYGDDFITYVIEITNEYTNVSCYE